MRPPGFPGEDAWAAGELPPEPALPDHDARTFRFTSETTRTRSSVRLLLSLGAAATPWLVFSCLTGFTWWSVLLGLLVSGQALVLAASYGLDAVFTTLPSYLHLGSDHLVLHLNGDGLKVAWGDVETTTTDRGELRVILAAELTRWPAAWNTPASMGIPRFPCYDAKRRAITVGRIDELRGTSWDDLTDVLRRFAGQASAKDPVEDSDDGADADLTPPSAALVPTPWHFGQLVALLLVMAVTLTTAALPSGDNSVDTEPVPYLPQTGEFEDAETVSISADGRFLATTDGSRTLVRDLTRPPADSASILRPPVPEEPLFVATFAAQANRLVTSTTARGEPYEWPVIWTAHETGDITRAAYFPEDDYFTSPLSHLALSADAEVLVTKVEGSDTAVLWDIRDLYRPLERGTVPGTPIMTSTTDRLLAMSHADRDPSVWDIADPAHPVLIAQLAGYPVGLWGREPNDAAGVAGHVVLVNETAEGNVGQLWSLHAQGGEPTPERKLPIGPMGVVGNADSRIALVRSGDDETEVWDVTDWANVHPVGRVNYHVTDFAYSAAAGVLAAVDHDDPGFLSSASDFVHLFAVL